MYRPRHRSLGSLILAISCFAICAPVTMQAWAETRIVANEDRNHLIHVQDALATSDHTRLVYYTSPDRTQGHIREGCTANVYLLDVKPQLPAATPQLLAENICSGLGMTARLLNNGNVMLVMGDNIAIWHPDKAEVAQWKLGAVKDLQSYGGALDDESTPLAANRQGDIVIAGSVGGKRAKGETPPLIVTGLDHKGATRWQQTLHEAGAQLNALHIWSTADGGALVHVSAKPTTGNTLPAAEAPPGAIVAQEERLYRLSNAGQQMNTVTLASVMMPDPGKPIDMQALSENPSSLADLLAQQQKLSRMEAIDQILGHTLADGSVALLVRRGSSDKSRTGTVYFHIGADGKVQREAGLAETLQAQNLRTWTDFTTSGDQLLLYGTTGTRQNRLPQGYLSTIDLTNGQAITKLVPLNQLGLAAARDAADEQVQKLEHNPGQQTVMLTELAQNPLMVSLIRQSRRPAIQLDEGTGHVTP